MAGDDLTVRLARWLRTWDTEHDPKATAWEQLDDANRQQYLDGARQLLTEPDLVALEAEVKQPKAWRHRWQVVRCWTTGPSVGAYVAVCSHRTEWAAEWCSLLRRDRPDFYHDYRRTPEVQHA